jgi:hypothetical protein
LISSKEMPKRKKMMRIKMMGKKMMKIMRRTLSRRMMMIRCIKRSWR